MLTTWAHSQAETRIPAPPLFPPHPQLWRELPAVHRWDVEPEITYIVFSFARFLAWTPVGLIDLCFVARAGRPREAALAEFLSHGHMCQQGPEEVFWRGFLACRLELRRSWLQISSDLKRRGWAPWNFSPLPPSSWWRFLLVPVSSGRFPTAQDPEPDNTQENWMFLLLPSPHLGNWNSSSAIFFCSQHAPHPETHIPSKSFLVRNTRHSAMNQPEVRQTLMKSGPSPSLHSDTHLTGGFA